MAKGKDSSYLKLEKQIAADERGGVMHRWRYGRELLGVKAGRRQLPHGLTTELIVDATRAGLKLSEREIQYRIKCASIYGSEAEVRTACAEFGSWSALREAGFPAVEIDEPDDLIDEAEAGGIPLGAPDEFEQLTLIPGLPETLKVNGRRVPLAEATVADAKAYRETFRQIHENFGKTLGQIEIAVGAMERGSGGDDAANALEAYRRATEEGL